MTQNESLYLGQDDEDIIECLNSLPSGTKSETMKKALRQYFVGHDGRQERIGELEAEREECEQRIAEQEERIAEIDEELERLRAAAEEDDDGSPGMVPEVINLFDSLVRIPMDNREKHLRRQEGTVPSDVWQTVYDDVDIHCFVHGRIYDEGGYESLEAVVEDVGFSNDVLDDVTGNKVEDDEAVSVLQHLTPRERDAVEEAAKAVLSD